MKKILIVIMMFCVYGCASNETLPPWETIYIGMPKTEVLEAMGRPGGVSVDGNQEILTYHIDEDGGWALAMRCAGASMSGDPIPYECNRNYREEEFRIRLTDGLVSAYGKVLANHRPADPQYTRQRSRQSSESSGAVNPDPSNKQFQCNDALRRYEAGAISFDQMERACGSQP